MRIVRPFTRRLALTRGVVSACLALLIVQVAAGAAPAARRTRLQPLASSPSGAFVQDGTVDKRGGERDGSRANVSARMVELEATLERLRRLGAHESTDNALRAQWEAAVLEYAALSNAHGGDRAPTRSAGDEAEASRAPESAPPAPPNCTASQVSFTNSTPVAIPSGPGVVTSTIVVSGADPYLYDVDVQTFITHTFPADLDVTVTSPAGTVVTLTTDNAGTNDNVFNGTVWDDDADPNGVAPFTAVAESVGTNANSAPDHPYANNVVATPLAPEEALGAFLGENPNGTWTLTVSDDAAGISGSLNSWSLMVTALPSAPTTATATGSNTTPVAIAATGNPTITSQITISTPGTSILDVNVTTAITHTFSQDLQITLTHGATTVTLASNPINEVAAIGDLDNVYNGTTWDDDANPGGQVPYTSNAGLASDHPYVNNVVVPLLAPSEALAAFIGEDPNGVWTLTIGDRFNGDGGSLNSWSLNITTASCAAATSDLATTKTASPMVVGPGQNVTYTVTTTNNGTATPGTITVTDTLPANAAFVSATPSAGGSVVQTVPVGSMGGTLVYSYPGVATGNSVTLTVVVTVPAGTADGTLITNMATGTSNLFDPMPGNDSATVSATVQRSADISLTKTASPDPVATGGQITYAGKATNNGPDTPDSITITDALPAGVIFVSATGGAAAVPDPAPGSTGGVVMHSFTSAIGAGQSVMLTVVVGVPVATADGTVITNMASAASNVTDPTPGNNTASATTTATDPAPTVTCPANITAGATTMEGSTQGANVAYTTPTATDNAPGATVACVPASGSFFPLGATTVTCTATDSAGGTGTCSFTVTVASALTNCFVDDTTGDTLSIAADPGSPLYRKWLYRVAATGEIIRGSAESVVYYPGRSLVAYDHDTPTVRMDLSVNYASRSATAMVRTLGAGGRTLTLRDRNTANNPPCQ